MIKKEAIFFAVLITTFFSTGVYAAICGGVIACNCGDTLNESRTLTGSDTLTGCAGNGLNINTSDLTLDCDGYNISGSGSGYGVNISKANDTIIKNCLIHSFYYGGILASLSKNVNITGNTIYNITFVGAELISVSGNETIFASANVTGNNLTGGDSGIFCSYSTINIIDNDINGQRYGIENGFACGTADVTGNRISGCTQAGALLSSSHNVTGNNITGNYYGIWNSASSPKIYHNNIYNNTLNVNSATALNLSLNNEGNYWGHTSCPVFTAGVDSNSANVVDYYPYNLSYGWETASPTICDTTGPSITITNPLSGAKVPRITDYVISGNVTDETLVSSITVTMSPVFSGPATYNSSDGTWSFVTDMTAATEGYYNITVNATDLYGNINDTTKAINVQVDGTPPAITNVAIGSITLSGATITWNTNESSNSTVYYGTAISLGSSISSTDYTTSNSVILSGLSSSTLYYYNVTSCDQAGNCKTEGTYSFTTSEEPSVPGGGGSYPLFSPSQEDMSKGFEKTLIKNGKVHFTLKGQRHSLTVDKITENNVTLIIQSGTKTIILSIGETQKIDIDDNGIYDLQVTLKSINDGRADVLMQTISEEIPEIIPEELECETDADCPENYECVDNLCSEIGKPVRTYFLYILIAVIVVIAALIIWLRYYKK